MPIAALRLLLLEESIVRKILQYDVRKRARPLRTSSPRESLDMQEVGDTIKYILTTYTTRVLN